MSNLYVSKDSPKGRQGVQDKRIRRYMRCLGEYRSVKDKVFFEKNDPSLQPVVVLNPILSDSNIPVFERSQGTGEKNGSVITPVDGMSDFLNFFFLDKIGTKDYH